jgi:mRNA-degrading endonuclease RelE of RelBE toxin-antitoxin system
VNYRLRIEQPALKEIRDLPGHVRAQAEMLIAALPADPRSARAKELQGKPGIYRLWLAGRWRLVYEIDDESQVIFILRVRRKEQIDYESVEGRGRVPDP